VTCDILLEISWQDYNFALNLISIEGLHTKLWALKVVRVPILKISGLPLRSLETKWHLGANLVAKHGIYYKGEGGGFPQVWVVVNLVSSCLPMVRLCTKVLQLHLNQLVVWFVRPMWVIELLVNLPIPIAELQHTPLPPKCYEPKNAPQLILLLLYSPLDS
jgi:hypothetical protein